MLAAWSVHRNMKNCSVPTNALVVPRPTQAPEALGESEIPSAAPTALPPPQMGSAGAVRVCVSARCCAHRRQGEPVTGGHGVCSKSTQRQLFGQNPRNSATLKV